MKTITIPKRFGYPTANIVINGKEETFQSGVEISVDDSIAEVIENALELEPKPKRYLNKFAQRIEGSISEITESDLEGIENISSYGFALCKMITQVTIPDTVKVIDTYAFYACITLKSVSIGNNVTRIGISAFNWCSNLQSVYLPEVPPVLEDTTAFDNTNKNCVFYCKTQASLDAYKAAPNWSTLTGTYTFVVED